MLHTPYFLRNLHWVSKTTCLIDYCPREKCWQQQLYSCPIQGIYCGPRLHERQHINWDTYPSHVSLQYDALSEKFKKNSNYDIRSILPLWDLFYMYQYSSVSKHKVILYYHLLHYFGLSWYPHQCNKEAVNEYQR